VGTSRRTLRIVATLLAVVVAATAARVAYSAQAVDQPEAAAVPPVVPAPAARFDVVERRVEEGQTAGEVLRDMGAPAEGILAAAGRGLDRLSVGESFRLEIDAVSRAPLRLAVDGGDPWRSVFHPGAKGWRARQQPIPYRIEVGKTEVRVESSLWESATDAGFSPAQIMSLASIFEYDVDFNTELVKGAAFAMVTEALEGEGGGRRIGDIRACVMDNGGKRYVAFRYRAMDGTVGWFDYDGKARKKSFLRSPLAFSRVTSGFSKGRFHPVLKVKRPHQGTDFGAPTGTPVRSVADGVVRVAGTQGGHGRYVEIEHSGGYRTSYSHLSKIEVRQGAKVRQGQEVGKVGSTGLATGPHLHYQLWINGKLVDPMRASIAQVVTLGKDELGSFAAARDKLLPVLGGLDAVRGRSISPRIEDPAKK
jgi:murein DD-endopeptidase MepM/ murein hydrolase activator NlpD